MTGGDISENTATASGGGVYNNGGTFTVSDQWTITGNKLGSSLDAVTSNVNVIPTGTISDQNLPGYGHVFTLAITAPTYSATDGVPIGGSLQIQAALTGLGPYSETITWSAYWIGEGGETPAGSEVTITPAGLVSVADTVMPGTLKVRAADAENLKSDELELLVKSSRDLRAKFPGDSTLAGSFNAIHAYVTGNAEFGGASSKIQLGDYIDLESLTVVGKQQGTSTTYRGAVTGVSNTEITVDGVPHGRLLRLIVVGINTYRAIDNDGVDGNSNDVPHIVLHFQHLPVTPTSSTNRVPIHWTSGAAPSIGAYSSSVFMYQYLADNFYRGLKNAGIPEGVFWNPARIAGNGSGSATTLLADAAVWLPTAREMFGTAATGDTTETSANQGVFEYYNTDNSTTNAERRKKYRSDNSSGDYILATNMGLTGANRVQFVKVSSSDGTTQSGINGYIATNPSNNNVNYFFAPAFCIGGASAP
jgi:hypothetical protein